MQIEAQIQKETYNLFCGGYLCGNIRVPLGTLRVTPGYPLGTPRVPQISRENLFLWNFFRGGTYGRNYRWTYGHKTYLLLINHAKALKISEKLWMFKIFAQKISLYVCCWFKPSNINFSAQNLKKYIKYKIKQKRKENFFNAVKKIPHTGDKASLNRCG